MAGGRGGYRGREECDPEGEALLDFSSQVALKDAVPPGQSLWGSQAGSDVSNKYINISIIQRGVFSFILCFVSFVFKNFPRGEKIYFVVHTINFYWEGLYTTPHTLLVHNVTPE